MSDELNNRRIKMRWAKLLNKQVYGQRYLEICDHENCPGCYTEYSDFEIVKIHAHYWSRYFNMCVYYVEWNGHPIGTDMVVKESDMICADRLLTLYWQEYREFLFGLLAGTDRFVDMPVEIGFHIVDLAMKDLKHCPQYVSEELLEYYEELIYLKDAEQSWAIFKINK